MALSWARGTIAAVSTEHQGDPTRCVILDGHRLQSNRSVNQRISADGTVYTQGFDTEGRGAKFGVRIDSMPIDMFQTMITNINGAIDAFESFDVVLEDDWQSIDRACTVDGTDWLSYAARTTNEEFVEAVVMRFITTD